MKEKGKDLARFLTIRLFLVAALCVCIFSFLAIYMNQKSAGTIREVSRMYMSGMSEQIAMHFDTAIGLRLDQLDTLVKTVLSDSIHDDPVQQERLRHNAQAREFSYLAFYHSDGTFDMLYGSPLEVINPEPFLNSLSNNEMKVTVGTDSAGNMVVLLGVPAAHQPTEEHPCIGLVAGIPVSYVTDTLSLEENKDHIYSFIVRRGGSFVIRTSDAVGESYFDRVRSLYESVDGGDPELYIAALSDAMEQGRDYSAEFVIYGESRQVHCTRLAHSEWFLLTFMPYSALDQMVSGFASHWVNMVFGACVLVLAALLLVFRQYLRLLRGQMRELEASREEALHANRAKSEFLSNMSHDIRTPMNAIVGMTAIAISNIDNTQQVQHCLKKITQSSRHLLGLINDVLDMSKIESGKMTLNVDQVSLREVVEGIVSIVQPQVQAKHQKFNVFIHDITVENVCCDSVRLNQVLLNFLSNAIKFTPEEGAIQLSLSEEPSPLGEDRIRTHLTVQDTGIGMTPEFQTRIFDSFTREDSARVQRTEGTGLGMAITRHIVDAMGGTIEMDSAPGRGTKFHVTLDLLRAEIQEEDMVLPEWNMLVVDDDRELCESAVTSLQSIGLLAEWTLDGESAVEMAEERHCRHDGYHIILLDWKLPGMDGIATARELRRRLGEDIPILLISAYDWGDIEADARAAGVSGFISKPLFKSTLFYGLRPYVDKSVKEADAAETKTDLTGRRILVAEDNELNWEIAAELLGELGLELEWAEDGQICAEKFQASPEHYYDAILMDLRMPVMSGYEATQVIRLLERSDAASVPIIAMTADAFSEDIRRCLDCGMNAHIAKPIDMREVTRLLEKYCK